MGEMTSSGTSAGIDPSQFYQVFFGEAGENLGRMEQLLLEVDITRPTTRTELDLPLRLSSKGRAATIGFMDVAELTHQMERCWTSCAATSCAPTTGWSTCCCLGRRAARQLARHQTGREGGRHHRAAVQHPRHGPPAGRLPRAGAGCRRRAPAAGREHPGAGRNPAANPATRAMLELRVGPLATEWPTTSSSCSGKSPTSAPSRPIDGGQADGMRRFKWSPPPAPTAT